MELAAGRIPDRLAILKGVVSMRQACSEWIDSLHHVTPRTRVMYAKRATVIGNEWGARSVGTITPRHVQAWIRDQVDVYAPTTIGQHLAILRLVLDHAGATPNPARDASVKLPVGSTQNRVRIPTALVVDDVQRRLAAKYLPAWNLMLRAGLRIEEAHRLEWVDVDVDRRRLFVRQSKTRSGVRFVDDLGESHHGFAAWLDWIGPPGLGRVTAGTTLSGFDAALDAAIDRADVNVFGPHDLRHLHASRLLDDGMSPAVLAARLGHGNPAVTLRVYAHVVPG